MVGYVLSDCCDKLILGRVKTGRVKISCQKWEWGDGMKMGLLARVWLEWSSLPNSSDCSPPTDWPTNQSNLPTRHRSLVLDFNRNITICARAKVMSALIHLVSLLCLYQPFNSKEYTRWREPTQLLLFWKDWTFVKHSFTCDMSAGRPEGGCEYFCFPIMTTVLKGSIWSISHYLLVQTIFRYCIEMSNWLNSYNTFEVVPLK